MANAGLGKPKGSSPGFGGKRAGAGCKAGKKFSARLPIFEERLLERIYEVNVTVYGLGESLGVTGGAVSRWIHGRSRPPLEVLSRLAQVLGTTPNYLLGWSDSPAAVAPIPANVISDLERAVRQLKSLARPRVVRRLKEA